MQQDIIFTSLLSYATLGGNAPSVSDADWTLIYGFARMHGVGALLYRAVKSGGYEGVPENVLSALEKANSAAFRRCEIQAAQTAVVTAELTNAGIDCMPVKGAQTARLYSDSYLRESGDVDILIPPDKSGAAEDVMCRLGYKIRERGMTETAYTLGCLVFELHTMLQEDVLPPCLSGGVYSFPKDATGLHSMSDEDIYLYLIVHACKHMRSAGCGVRYVLDFAVMNQKCNLNREYIKAQLEAVGLVTFEERLHKLADYLFFGGEGDEITENFALFVMSSGIHGTPENAAAIAKMHNPDEKAAGRLLKRLFPPYSEMIKTRKYLKNLPFLLPISWLCRIIKSTPVIKRKAKTENAAYKVADTERVRQTKALFDALEIK